MYNTTTGHINPSIGAARTETPLPEYRLVQKNGALALQRAYAWQQGQYGGHEWRDLPIINLDNHNEGL